MRNKPAALWTIWLVSPLAIVVEKIRRGLSAGRVQSPALRLICERENEIRAFEAQEYWTVHLDSHKGRSKFTAKLAQYNGAKLEQFDLPNEAAQADVLKELEAKRPSLPPLKRKAQPQSRCAVYHFYHAAGCRTQTRLHHRPHHAYRPTALRRYRRRAGCHRSDYLYAYRQREFG